MDNLKMDTDRLQGIAAEVEGIAARYEGAYNRILGVVDSLRPIYYGQAAEAFYTQTDNFRNDFQALKQLFDKYSEYLFVEGNNYQFTENNVLEHVRAATSGGNSF